MILSADSLEEETTGRVVEDKDQVEEEEVEAAEEDIGRITSLVERIIWSAGDLDVLVLLKMKRNPFAVTTICDQLASTVRPRKESFLGWFLVKTKNTSGPAVKSVEEVSGGLLEEDMTMWTGQTLEGE